jgi:hypothetical protein
MVNILHINFIVWIAYSTQCQIIKPFACWRNCLLLKMAFVWFFYYPIVSKSKKRILTWRLVPYKTLRCFVSYHTFNLHRLIRYVTKILNTDNILSYLVKGRLFIELLAAQKTSSCIWTKETVEAKTHNQFTHVLWEMGLRGRVV